MLFGLLVTKTVVVALIWSNLLLLPTNVSANMIITEIMYNPTKVNHSRGEWFELYNNGTQAVNLKSWTVRDDKTDSFLIRAELIVQPKQYIVLANNGNASLNGGLPKVDYIYSSREMVLDRRDRIILRNPKGNTVDQVHWALGGFPRRQ
jgi:uncharacterized protein